jgi:glyoxylase-like metal-dependent hydrolase (beta-lactamase superfamily II)
MKLHILKLGIHNNMYPNKEEKLIDLTIDPICGAVVLIKGKENVLVDTGYFPFKEEIIEGLDKQGLKPEDIDYVINTHSHFDHCSNNYLFSNAKIICGASIWDGKACINYKNPEDIMIDGLKIITTPGHRQEHLSVIVKVDDKNYVISGDAIEEKKIVERKYDKKPNKGEIFNSIKKILEIADVIIPGHGPLIESKEIRKLKEIVKED